MNVNVSYKRVTSTRFSELLLRLLFLKNNQPQDNSYAKETFWGVILCSPSIPERMLQIYFYSFSWLSVIFFSECN